MYTSGKTTLVCVPLSGPAHGVYIPDSELKMSESTNLKMHLKPSVQDVCQNLDSCIVHCRWYTVGEEVPKLSFGSLGGWLEGESRRSSLRKFARARHSVRKQVAPRFKNGQLLKRQIFKIQARLITGNARYNLRFFACSMAPKDTCAAKTI